MPRSHVHQQVYNWRCQEASLSTLTLTLSYTNMVLSTTRGDNELRRAFTTTYTSKPEYTFGRSTCRWYTAKMHRARDANLCADMQICRDAYLVSVWLLHQLKYHLFGPRYSDTAEFRVFLLEWSWKCRIVAASLVLPFSMTEQSNHYFHWLMVSRRRHEKLRCIDWWSAKVSLNLLFGQKTGDALVKLRRRRRRAVLTFSAAAAPQSGGGGAARPAWGSNSNYKIPQNNPSKVHSW